MSDNSGVGQVDINVSADQAEATLKRLIQLAEQADQTFQQLQRDAVAAVNAAKIPLGGGHHPLTVSHADQARSFAQGGGADLVPGLSAKIADMDNRQRAIAAQVGQFVATQTPALAAASPTQLFGQYGAWRGQQPPLAGGSSSAGTGAGTPPLSAAAPTGANAAATQQQPASKQRQPAATAAPTTQATAPTGANAAANQQQSGSPAQSFGQAAATQFANALRQSGMGGAGSGGALVNRGVQVGLAKVANASGLGGMGSGGLIRAGAEALGPVGVGALALGAAGLAVNSQQATFNQQAQGLAAAEPGSPFQSVASREGVLGATDQAAAFTFTDPQGHGVTAATALARAGVRGQDLTSAAANTFALTRLLGSSDPAAATQLTGGLMTQGGMTGQEVNTTYQQLDKGATVSSQSLTRLVDALSTLQKTANGSRVNIEGLTAAQKLLSAVAPNANIGQVLGGAIGATGGQAIAQASLLGLSSDAQLQAVQAHPDQLYDRLATLAKRLDRGKYGVEVTEGVLQSSGLADLSGMNAQQQRAFVQQLATGKPGAAEALAKHYGQQVGPTLTTQDQSLGQWARATENNTSAVDRLTATGQDIIANILNGVATPISAGGTAATQNTLIHKDNPALAQAFLSGNASPEQVIHIRRQYPLWYAAHSTTTPVPSPTPAPKSGPTDYSATGDAGSATVPVYRKGALNETDTVGSPLMGMYVAAARAHNTPGLLKAALAVSAMESGFNPGAVQAGGNGRGIAQFDLSLNQAGGETGSNLANSAHYLGVKLTGNPFTDVPATERAALDPKRAIPGQAAMLSDLYHSHHDNWQAALSAYNGSGPAAAQYGQDVSSSIGGVHVIEVKGTLYDTLGNPIGTIHPTKTTVDHTRKPVGHATHGPGRR